MGLEKNLNISSQAEARHGPEGRKRRFYTDVLSREGLEIPEYVSELDRAIAEYAGRAAPEALVRLGKKIKALEDEGGILHKKTGGLSSEIFEIAKNGSIIGIRNPEKVTPDLKRLYGIEIEIAALSHDQRNIYGQIYTRTWEAILTRNGTRSMEESIALPSAELFPSRSQAERLAKVCRYDDNKYLERIVSGVITELWPQPRTPEPPKGPSVFQQILSRFRSAGKENPAPAVEAPVSAPGHNQEEGASSASVPVEPLRLVRENPQTERSDSPPVREITRVPVREADPVPSESRERETRGVPDNKALVLVSATDTAAEPQKKHWARRALGAAFNMAAGAGAGVAVKASVLALTGGSAGAAIGAGAVFAGLLSVGRQHMENVRTRREESPQTQGWALHREVFGQNAKSYGARFLTSTALFFGGGALGYAYGDQVVGWVSEKMESVANLFHSVAGEVVAPVVAPVSAPLAEVMPVVPVPETPVVAVEPPVTETPVVPEPVPTPAPEVSVEPPPVASPEVDSRALALENVRAALGAEKITPEVQDALRRAASENPRIGAQGLKDLADYFAQKKPSFALSLAEEALKTNPQNAQAALFVAHYETHGVGGAPVDLAGAYEKAAQVQASSSAGAAQKREAADLLRYLTRTLRFNPA